MLSQIIDGLSHLGVVAGDTLLVHSSLSALGYVEGGADTVIDALLGAIGPDGTLLMPSFQNGGQHAIVRRGCTFDVRHSPSELGIISETFRRRPGVIRSLSPTHCTAGTGPAAAALLADHHLCTVSVGRGSPYDKLVRAGGKILLLGVGHESNTTLHLIENTRGAPTVSRERFEPVVIDADGREWIVPTYPHMPGLARRYGRAEDALLAHGAQRNGSIGNATARLIDAASMADLIGQRIANDPLYLIDVFTP
jgi:aminoglycoside 3-N-acetyltransferase